MSTYVHGYSQTEANRLIDQADTLAHLFHHDSIWEEGSLILEAGCGVGGQTKTIAAQNPHSKFVSIDLSEESIREAQALMDSRGIKNVEFQVADIFNLPFEDEYFDHIFLCFILEHLPDPKNVLELLKAKLKPNGTITIIDGDHASTIFHPESEYSNKAIQCQRDLQNQKGGDVNIGRKLYPILKSAGFKDVKVTPRPCYTDDSKPTWVEGYTKNAYIRMIEGVREEAIAKKMISAEDFDRGIQDLYRVVNGGGTYCCTFFKGSGVKK